LDDEASTSESDGSKGIIRPLDEVEHYVFHILHNWQKSFIVGDVGTRYGSYAGICLHSGQHIVEVFGLYDDVCVENEEFFVDG
jgi:hypothetical protein